MPLAPAGPHRRRTFAIVPLDNTLHDRHEPFCELKVIYDVNPFMTLSQLVALGPPLRLLAFVPGVCPALADRDAFKAYF